MRVEAPHFVAGIIVDDEKVLEAAPILQWAVGWPLPKLGEYFRRKGWRYREVKR